LTAARTFAQQALEADGYTVVRSASGTRTVDLVAWQAQKVRFILVRRVREHRPASVVAVRFAAEIATLREIPLPDGYTCTAELWLFHRPDGFRRYRVYRGGIMEAGSGRQPACRA